jgi:hypothetical protein
MMWERLNSKRITEKGPAKDAESLFQGELEGLKRWKRSRGRKVSEGRLFMCSAGSRRGSE